MAKNKRTLSNTEIAAFCEQLGFILNAGISLQEGLLILSEDKKGNRGAQISGILLEKVEMGGSFAAALKDSAEFPAYMVNMVEIGETSGKLQEVLESLVTYYERNEAINKNIKNAIAYPAVMIVMMLAVILIIIIEVLPVFQNVFLQLGSDLSPFVQGIIQFGEFASNYSVWIIAGLGIIVAAILIARSTEGGKRFFSSIYEKMFKKTSAAIAAGRFASAMTLMLGSGMDVDESLNMTMELIQNNSIKQKIKRMKDLIDGGEPFADAIVKADIFSELYGKMITVGFKTGTLEEVMKKISRHYDEETSRKINGLVAALEPTLVVILSLIVGLIILSVMLPLMGVMTAIG